ncbi:MAG: hypothetical protein PHV34_09005 [Verrucomicrobiae bacterium]|nr:hypothetical protein [Verrucomicrobiae bacterium]
MAEYAFAAVAFYRNGVWRNFSCGGQHGDDHAIIWTVLRLAVVKTFFPTMPWDWTSLQNEGLARLAVDAIEGDLVICDFGFAFSLGACQRDSFGCSQSKDLSGCRHELFPFRHRK